MRRHFTRRRIQFGAGFAVAVAATAMAPWHTWLNPPVQAAAADESTHLAVDLSARKLVVYNDDSVVSTYSVAIGAPSHPTPTGTFSIRKIVWNPPWIPPNTDWAKNKQPQPPGATANPTRVVKIYFKEPDYYIHGTNAPESIGDAASHGCLRMDENDAAALARYLMEHGGQPRPESWFSRVLHYHSETETVYLDNPVSLTITGRVTAAD